MSTPNDHLKDYLTGMHRARREALEQLATFPNWREVAKREIERRATEVVRMFGDELLAAIACGEVDVNATIADVLAAH